MNAISPSLSQALARLSRPVPDDGEGGSKDDGSSRSDAGSRPDYIAAIEAALIAPVRRVDPAVSPAGTGYTGNANSLVARLQARRTPPPVVKAPPPAPR